MSILTLIQSIASDPALPIGSRVGRRNDPNSAGVVTSVSGAAAVEVEWDDAPTGDTELVSVDALCLLPPKRAIPSLRSADLDDPSTLGTIMTRFQFGATTDPGADADANEDDIAAWMQENGV